MSAQFTDTLPEAAAVQRVVLRRMGPERRMELCLTWSEALRQTAMQGIRDRNPGYSERQVVLEYARITLGEKLFRAAFAGEAALIDR